MTPAQVAYKKWKDSHLVNMRVYTDEQMFELGYNARSDEIEELLKEVEQKQKKVKK